MEIDAANVARHKRFFFAGSQVSSTKEMNEKNRFGELSTEEITDYVGPVTTKSHKVRNEIIQRATSKLQNFKYER